MYVLLVMISNIGSAILLIAAPKWPIFVRISFFLLFGWACGIIWKTAVESPHVYVEYLELTWGGWYSSFINGWFASHVKLVMCFIAAFQGLIGASMLLKETLFKIGCFSGIIFFVAALTLGVGSGFSTTLMALSLLALLKDPDHLVWHNTKALHKANAEISLPN
jgi:hypothetical protein